MQAEALVMQVSYKGKELLHIPILVPLNLFVGFSFQSAEVHVLHWQFAICFIS